MSEQAVNKFAKKSKKQAKKPAKKLSQPSVEQSSGIGILNSIRSELAQEFTAKESTLLEKIRELEDKLSKSISQIDFNNLKSANVELSTTITQLRSKLDDSSKYLHRIDELTKQCEFLNTELTNMQLKFNNDLNMRTERMKEQLEKDYQSRSQKMHVDVLGGMHYQINSLYNKVATVFRDSKAPIFVLSHVLDLLKHTLTSDSVRIFKIEHDHQHNHDNQEQSQQPD